ncbi:MAG: hypothetical protein KDI61_07280 [Alphaproteobacteria bacterium]|nr:hypothetical protein [Alphaproteobacteria bacterium]
MPNTAEISIPTPLGTLRGYTLEHPNLKVSLSTQNHNPILPTGMSISQCKLLMWSIRAIRNCNKIKSVCKLEPAHGISEDPDTGEHVDCLTFETKKHILSLATDDGEYLNFRAKKKILPDRFVTLHPDGLYSWVNYIKNGLEIVVPELHASECVELRFSVAWKEKGKTKDDMSTWFGADSALRD